MPDYPSPRLTAITCVLTGIALLLVVWVHLLPALLAGLLVFALVTALDPPLRRITPGTRADWLVVLLISVVVVSLLSLAVFGIITFFTNGGGNPDLIFDRMMPLIDKARAQLPTFVVEHVPDNIVEIRSGLDEWLRMHAATLQLAGKQAVRVFTQTLIGMVLGAMVALSGATPSRHHGPLAVALATRCQRLGNAFRDIVFAQLKISLLNTLFTALFLLVVLPLFGVQLPLAKTLVAITFVAGLLPVLGNLISNAAIFVVAMSVSLWVAVAALTFLVLIHKLEYFLNARIVGGQIRARAWELLAAMLAMEAAFGVAGVIAAPIYYAYLKRELEAAKLI